MKTAKRKPYEECGSRQRAVRISELHTTSRPPTRRAKSPYRSRRLQGRLRAKART